jgi:3-deoxy-7-phosphoheptulonate synthase
MKYHTDDVRITGMQEVSPPEALLAELPISDAASQLVFTERREISDIIHGRDARLVVVIGPCSIHDPIAALEYADRLAEQARTYRDSLKIVMRVYFEKPRTTVGWKGLINDPHLNNSFDINLGLKTARGLLRALIEKGVATGTEYLDPISPQYFGDLVCWGAIGARTTESQIHRQLASGLSCPIGFKNSTDGSVQVAVDAVKSARHSHIFLSVTKQGRSAIFSTSGNEDCHIILRGGGRPNYDNPSVHYASRVLEQAGLVPKVMIDMSHANSNKQHRQQLNVCADICKQLSDGEPRIMGVMIESNLVEGRQELSKGRELMYGQSVTDACIGWDDSIRCLERLAEAVTLRNAHAAVAAPVESDDQGVARA